jgi:hypothetical protein
MGPYRRWADLRLEGGLKTYHLNSWNLADNRVNREIAAEEG